MPVTAFRLKNFMGFEDTGWIDLTNINLLFGSNSAGKSAIIRALLLLQQSVATWRPTDIDGRQDRRQDSLVFSEPNGHDLGNFMELVRDHDTNRAMTFGFRHGFSLADNSDMSRYFDGFVATLQLLGIVAVDLDPQVYELENIVLDTELSYRLQSIGDTKQVTLCAFGLYRAADNWDILEAELDESSGTWRFDSSTFGTHDPSFAWPPLRFITKSSFFPILDAPEGGLPQPRRTDYGLEGNFTAYYSEEHVDDSQEIDASLHLLKETDDTLTAFQSLLNFTLKDDIHRFIAFRYLGPIRPNPQRYIRAIQRPAIVNNPSLEDSLRLWLDAKANAELGSRLNQFQAWLSDALGLRFEFRPVDPNNQIFEFIVKDRAGFEANLADVGFGISQLLPILIHAACESRNSMLIVEQPELHLHPSGQLLLGDLFALLCELDAKLIIETHSEHLLLRFQKLIALTTIAASETQTTEYPLQSEQLNVYFVHRQEDVSTCTRIDVDDYGDLLTTPRGFEEFFSDDLFETAERARIRLSRN